MVDLLLYRLNRVPDRHYVKFLELLGVRLLPPADAETDVTFWLSAPLADVVPIAVGTEVSTLRTEADEAIVFTSIEDLDIVPCELAPRGLQLSSRTSVDYTDMQAVRQGSSASTRSAQARRRAAASASPRRPPRGGASRFDCRHRRRRRRPQPTPPRLGGVERADVGAAAMSTTTTPAGSTAPATSSCTCRATTPPR